MKPITHSKILGYLASNVLIKAMGEDFSIAISHCLPSQMQYLQNRWDCVFLADDSQVSPHYKAKALIAWATFCHKYAVTAFDTQSELNAKAFSAIDQLNDDVVLCDKFFHASPRIKEFLETPLVSLTRNPSVGEHITFFRKGDVIAFELNKKYLVAYVHYIIQNYTAPTIEFYDGIFDELPTWDMVQSLRAEGIYRYNDGIPRSNKFGVHGLKYVQDPANQVHLIASNIQAPPNNNHLQPSVGEWVLTYLPRLLELLDENLLKDKT